jgi:hypothetical protein
MTHVVITPFDDHAVGDLIDDPGEEHAHLVRRVAYTRPAEAEHSEELH